MTNLTDPIFHNEDLARLHFEALRWPDGRVCPHCGVIDESTLMKGKTTRAGLYKCNACRKPFSATMGTVYERSHIPLHKWLLATHLIVSSKKGISAHQLYRQLGFGSYRTAWFMAHRIREAMNLEDALPPFGSDGGMVEVDETFINQKVGRRKRHGYQHKMKVLSLVDRSTGAAKSFVIDKVTVQDIDPILAKNLSDEAHLMTDEHRVYVSIGQFYAQHSKVAHSAKQYVAKDNPALHTNTIEGFFSIFKRGMSGIYQHCGENHLHRYTREFDFRYTFREANGFNDDDRMKQAIFGTIGKRLTYQQPDRNAAG